MSTYSLVGYAGMLSDPVRLDAYEAALARAITPGCTVLEIGTGTGFFAVLACRMGAGLVHAVEPDDAVQVAREMAEANGVADRIVFHQELSTRVELDEPVDVLFSDLRGVLPLFQHHVASITDARTRLLKRGGVQIPLRDRVWVAPVSAPKTWREQVLPWGDHHRGLDLGQTRRRLSNLWCKARFEPDELVAPPALWAELDWTKITEPSVRQSMTFTLECGEPVHGLAAWFETDLAEGIGFSNAPGEPPALYGEAFFPLPEPLETASGEALAVDLRAHLVGDDYVWEWRLEHGHVRIAQNMLAGTVLTPDHFRRGAEGYRPRADAEGRIEAFVLGAMDGSATVGEIARRLQETFPDRFADYRTARDRVSALARERGE